MSNTQRPTNSDEKYAKPLIKWKQPQLNKTIHEEGHVLNLKRVKPITLNLPANKRNIAFVLDRTGYSKKIEDLIEKDNYQTLHKGPSASMERKVYNNLKKLQDHFDNRTRKPLENRIREHQLQAKEKETHDRA